MHRPHPAQPRGQPRGQRRQKTPSETQANQEPAPLALILVAGCKAFKRAQEAQQATLCKVACWLEKLHRPRWGAEGLHSWS